MPYQKSLYNLLVPYPDGRTIIFNAFSGALGLFQPDTLRRYHENKLSAEEEQTLVKKEILNSDSFAIVSTRYDFSTLLSKYGRKDIIDDLVVLIKNRKFD